jgi:DNA-binding XRE family transcriptional regulator
MNTHETEQPKPTEDRAQATSEGDASNEASNPGSNAGSNAGKPSSNNPAKPTKGGAGKSVAVRANNVRKLRTERMMSKAELARRAGLSTLTIDRVEKGMPCRMDTKRKILEALGLTPSDRVAVFGEEDT